MRKHSSKKYDLLKRILAVCMVFLLVVSVMNPVFASETMENDQTPKEQMQAAESSLEILQENIQTESTQNHTEQDQSQPNETEQQETAKKETEKPETEVRTTEATETEQKETKKSEPETADRSTEQSETQAQSDTEKHESEKETQSEKKTEEININSEQIQKQFNRQMKAFMSLTSSDDIKTQEVTKTFTDLYPQYANYNGEMEGISVEKAWIGDAEYNRPDSITLDLYLDDQVIDSLTLTAEDDWKGSFAGHYPAYKVDAKGNYVLDDKGEKVTLNYQVKEWAVKNYTTAYSQSRHQTTVDSSGVHLFVPATELKAGEQYIVVSSNQVGQQKIYRAEAYQTDKMLSSQVTVTDKTIKDKDGNSYQNYILMNDGDGSYDGLLWNAYEAGDNRFYMFSNVYEIWGECHGLIQMSSTQKKLSCLHVGTLGAGTDVATQGFYNAGNDASGNAYKTASSSENLYFYKEVTLPDGAFNSWQMEVFVSNRYDPPITVDPDDSTASEKVDMAVSKNWENDTEGDRPESITVHLYANGVDTGKTITLNKANNWSDSFKDLDVYKAGKKISYSVKEDVPEGYRVKYQYSNTDSSERTGSETSEQKGYWVRTDKLVDGETYLIVTSPGSGNVTGMEIKSGGGGFSWTPGNGAGTIKVDGPITINGQTYSTHITQEEAKQHTRMQWTAHAKGAYAANQVGYHNWFLLESVSNPGCYPKFNGQGDISDGTAHESLLYYGLQWKTGKGQNGYVALDENGNEQKRTPTVENYPNDFSYVFGAANDYFLLTNNHTGDANAQTAQTFYLYKFVPVSGPSATITNTKITEVTSLKVTKNWSDKNNEAGKRPVSIQVELLKNGTGTGITAELSDENNWTCTFEKLPKQDEKGKEIHYSAKECSVPKGYTSSIITGTVDGTEEVITYSYAWVPVTKMQDGKQYILADDVKGNTKTLGVANKKATLSGNSVSIKTDATLTDENGNQYSAYFTDEDAANITLWTAHVSGSYVTLENNGSYFQKGSGELKDSSEATALQYDDVRHALKDKKGNYMASNGDFNKKSPEAITYLYERVRIKHTTTVDTTQNVTTITNTYKEPSVITMPETGSDSRFQILLSGFWLLVGGTLLMINNKDRGVINKE